MSIWNDPSISYPQFASFLSNDKNKSLLKKSWDSATKNKTFVSELESHELSSILVSFMKICIKNSNNTDESPTNDQLQDSSHLFSDWIFENKLSGIPMSDDDDYNKMKLCDIFNNKLVFEWITESSSPLTSYIKSKNEHDPSLSQAEILKNNKNIMQKHPSLAHLFHEKKVNFVQNKFTKYDETAQQQSNQKFTEKQQEFDSKHHKIRKSKAAIYFNQSEIGYSVKRKCKMYSDKKLTKYLCPVNKGDLLGGKAINSKNGVVEILEPIKGFISSQYLKTFELNGAQWKFLQQQASISSLGGQQSLTLKINMDDLILPTEDYIDDDDVKQYDSNKKVKFSGAYNENEDEKKLEDNATSFNDPRNKSLKLSLREKTLKKCRQQKNKILAIKQTKRSAQQICDLWIAAFNLHDLQLLKECYSSQVSSQQFVNQELQTRDSVLQCFKQMFEASDDVGIEVTNSILKDGVVILEFKSFGSKKGSSTNGSASDKEHSYLASTPTKSGLPTKIINGVGVFHVNNGQITSQRLFWDQDQQWFSDMNVIKMPQSSTLSHFLYKNKLAPVLNLSDGHLDSGSSNGSDGNDVIGGHNATANNNNNDNDIFYEMQNEEFNEILALRGLNLSDLHQHDNKQKLKQQNKQKAMAQAMFWLAVGAMFVFIVPKYLGKPKK